MDKLPNFTKFHIAIGFTGVSFASLALLLRIPDAICIKLPARLHQRTVRPYHTIFGYVYLVCALFMPITSNWIWPRLGTPYEVIWFISTMYIAIVFGILAIRCYTWINRHQFAQDLLDIHEQAKKGGSHHAAVAAIVDGGTVTKDGDGGGGGGGGKVQALLGGGVVKGDKEEDDDDDDQKMQIAGENESQEEAAKRPRHIWLKYLHGFFMIYSYVMLGKYNYT